MENELLFNGEFVQMLQSAMFHGNYRLEDIPAMIAELIKEDRWQRRIVPYTKEEAICTTFEEFIRSPRPKGLESDIKVLRRFCQAVDSQEAREAEALLDEVTQNPAGRPISVDNINELENRPDGTSRQAALRRLRSQRPDLYERVLQGDLSPHAAMIEAGFRQKTITVPLEPESAAAALKRHFSPDDLALLVQSLKEEQP